VSPCGSSNPFYGTQGIVTTCSPQTKNVQTNVQEVDGLWRVQNVRNMYNLAGVYNSILAPSTRFMCCALTPGSRRKRCCSSLQSGEASYQPGWASRIWLDHGVIDKDSAWAGDLVPPEVSRQSRRGLSYLDYFRDICRKTRCGLPSRFDKCNKTRGIGFVPLFCPMSFQGG
jgi:hypothetical protein